MKNMKETAIEISKISGELGQLAVRAAGISDDDRLSQLVLAAELNLKALDLSKLSVGILRAKGEFKDATPASMIGNLDKSDDKDDEPIENTARVHLDDLKVKPASICTSEELQKHKATKVVNMIPFELEQFAPYGSDIRCTKPTKDRVYVRILAACRGKFVTIFQVFPGVKNPDRYELITLQKLGYLQRYTQPEYVTRWSDKGGVLAARKVWFMTTPKGEELLRKVGV